MGGMVKTSSAQRRGTPDMSEPVGVKRGFAPSRSNGRGAASGASGMSGLRTALRMDYMAISGNGARGTLFVALIPLAFALLPMMGDGNMEMAPIMVLLVMFYWLIMIGSLFGLVGGDNPAPVLVTGVMPASRRSQVRARYLSCGVLLALAFIESVVVLWIALVVQHDGSSPMWVSLPLGVVLFVVVAAVEIPVFYACDFAKAIQCLMWGFAGLFILLSLVSIWLPDPMGRVLAALAGISLPAWLAIGVVVSLVAILVSYRVSMCIWPNREL